MSTRERRPKKRTVVLAVIALMLLPCLAKAGPPVLEDGGIYRGGETVILPFTELNAEKPPTVEVWAMRPWSVFGTEGPDYVKLSPTRAGDTWQVTLPEFEESCYAALHLVKARTWVGRRNPIRRLALGLVRKDQKNGPMTWIHLPQRRQVYMCGEPIEVSAVVSAVGQPCAGALELRMVPPAGAAAIRLAERQVTLKANERCTFGFMLPASATRTLRPGRCLLQATLPGSAAAGTEIELISPVRATHYPIPFVSYGDHSLQPIIGVCSRAVHRVRGKGRSLATQQTVAAGFNTFVIPLLIAKNERPTRVDALYRKVQTRPELAAALPPVENMVYPYEWSDTTEELLRNGAALLPGLYSYYYSDQPVMPCASEALMGRRERMATLSTQAMRRYPHFAGLMYSHWARPPYGGPDKYARRDQMLCLEPLWQEFSKQNCPGLPFPGDWWLWRVPAVGPLSAQNPELWLKWVNFVQGVPSRPLKRLRNAAGAICPQIIHTDTRAYPRQRGFPIYDPLHAMFTAGHDVPHSTQGLDTVITNANGLDWETMPYMQSVNCDLYSTLLRRGRGCWSVSTRGPVELEDKSTFLRDTLQQLARGAVPCFEPTVYCYTSWSHNKYLQNETMEWTHQQGSRDRVQLCTRMLKQYGDVFLRLRTRSEVAILASFTQGAFDDGRVHGHAIYQLGVTCLYAGHPATYLYESDIEAGDLEDCSILLLSSIQRDLPASVTTRISEFIRRGGRVIADGATTVRIPGIERMDLTFDEWRNYFVGHIRDFFKDRKKVYSKEIHESTWWKMNGFAAEKAPALKEVIEKSVQRRMNSPDPRVFVSRNTAGDMTYWFVVNFHSMEGLPRYLPGSYQHWAEPTVVWLDVDEVGDGAIYDLFEMKRVVPVREGKRARILCDLRALEGRVYAWTPEPIAGVELSVRRKVSAGERLPIRVVVKGTSGQPLAGPAPVAVIVRSPQGEEVYRIYRAATAQGLAESFPIHVHAEAGEWEVVVQERLSGKAARATFVVKASAPRQLIRARPLADCTVVDAEAIAAFARRKRPMLIPLDNDQENLREIAENAAARLRELGIQCQVRPVDEVVTGRNYQLWKPPPRRINSPAPLVPGDLLLIALPGQNRLLESLRNSDVLLRNPGPDYPGPGRGLVQYVWDAFCPKCDTIVVVGGDLQGVNEALDKTFALLSRKGPARGVSRVAAPEKSRGAFIPGDARRRRDPEFPAVKTRSLGLRPQKGSPTQLTGPEDMPLADRTGVPLYCMDCSPDGSKIVVGTDSHGHNLRVFSRAGAPLASFSAGALWPHKVAITNDGTVVAATTADHRVSAWKADGSLIWTAAAITERNLDGMLGAACETSHAERTVREPDYFAVSPDRTRLYLVLPGQKLVCRETQTGKDLWTYDFSQPPAEQLLPKPMRVCVSADGKKVAVSVKYGFLKNPLSKDYFAGAYGKLTKLIPKDLYNAAAPRVIVLDAESGKPFWEKTMGMPRMRINVTRGAAWGAWPLNGIYPEWWKGERLPAAVHYEFVPNARYPFGKSLGISPDGRWLCASAQGRHFALYSLERSDHEKRDVHYPGYALGGRMVFSGDGNTMAIVPLQCNGTNPAQTTMPVGLWIHHLDAESGAVVRGKESPSDCAINHDGSRIALGRWDGYLYVADRAGKVLWKRWVGGGSRVALSPDGKRILAGTSTGKLYAFDLEGNELWQASCTTPAQEVADR